MISHSTSGPPGMKLTEWDMSVRPVKLEPLDQDRVPLGGRLSTGFLFYEREQVWLYTCWHVVTGIDPFRPQFKDPPSRRFVKVTWKQMAIRDGGHTSLGDTEDFIVPLYDGDGKPLWHQEGVRRSQLDLDALGLPVPATTDLVALSVSVIPDERRFRCFSPSDVPRAHFQNGQQVVITGYPWGYSALGPLTPEPVFLTRSIASWVVLNRAHSFLVDGVGAKGMSGSPVFVPDSGGFKLIGVYSGALFPDVQQTGEPQDAYSGLGEVIRFEARQFFNWSEPARLTAPTFSSAFQSISG